MLYIKNFLKYSIFVGHSALNSLMLSSWFFYKLKRRIWIINLFKTILFLKLALKFLNYLVSNRLPFWFINMEFDKEFIFKRSALECGEYYCTRLWIRGLLSNFKSIQNSINNYILRKAALKNSIKKDFIKNWPLTRYTWPRGIFLSNIPNNYVICKEAGTMGLPVISMVDTNIKSFLFTFPIPSNDDALSSVCYIINIVSKQILLIKYKKLMLWYNKYKVKNIRLLNTLKSLGFKKLLFWRKIKNKKIKFFKMVKIKFFNKKFFSKLFFNKYWTNYIISSLFDKLFNFNKNMKLINSENLLKIKPFINYQNSDNINNFLLFRKLKFLRKLSNRAKFYSKFIIKYNHTFTMRPKTALSNSIRLKYLNMQKNKNRFYKNKSKFYFNYLSIVNIIKKLRIYNETFFINKPSEHIFVRRCHKPVPGQSSDTDYWRNKNDTAPWYSYYGYKYKINEEQKAKWLKKKMNVTLSNIRNPDKVVYSDTAIPCDINRWALLYLRPLMISKWRRRPLNYWLFPFIRKFSIKNYYKFYQPYFYLKEDKKVKYNLSLKLPIRTPYSSLNYYCSWFLFLLKNNKRDRVYKKRKRRIQVPSYVY